jgi:RimJ/RimL family protein N-acetyltransferase
VDAEPVARAAAELRGALPVGTGRCLLRVVQHEDSADLQGYRGVAEVTQFLGHPPLDTDQVEDLVASWLLDAEAVTAVAEHEGRVVGDVRLRFRRSSALWPAATTQVEAAVGYAFHSAVQGQGLATECVGSMVHLALRYPAVRRVTARVFAPAVRSARLLDRLGFSRDGIDRAAVLSPDGTRWWDDELWSVLREGGGMPDVAPAGPPG